jgi:ATP-dependent Clp protease ATP-binding subunit ClpB
VVDAELQDQLASPIGVQAEAHDVAETRARRFVTRRLELDVTAAVRELALSRLDPLYEARPLRRLVQSAIGDQLARRLLAGEIRDSDTVRVNLDAAADRLTVTRG